MHGLIHIGTEKTGTTSIQEFINKNTQNFNKNNIKTLKSFGKYSQSSLCIFGINTNRSQVYKNNFSLNNKTDIHSKRKELSLLLGNELSKFNHDDSVLISSEHLHSLLQTKEEILNFKKALILHGVKTFKIIIFLRPHADLYVSRISTIFKSGFISNLPGASYPWSNHSPPHLYKYKKSLKTWIEAFSDDEVSVNKYSKNIVENFLESIDVYTNDYNLSTKYKNKPLSPEYMHALYMARNQLNSKFRNKNDLKKFIHRFSNNEYIKSNSNRIAISTQIKDKFNINFKEDINFIQKKYNFSIQSNSKIDGCHKINKEHMEKIYKMILKKIDSN